ncbi:uncharacterized protein LOC124659528 [Lolium rigidum]|uniref:uncharacterized protein LOC124659528 n=1 Tax=Lolium rigidum TaxID=89674 RepID=UPI001F5E0E61|nr:uncharacterized protein LOC124659528 [Lolium rigidum]
MEARRHSQEPTVARDPPSGEESDDEFEFSFGAREPAATGGAAIPGDELVYPVFGRVFEDARTAPPTPADRTPLRRLFLEEARNSSVGSNSSTSSSYSSATADLDGASPDTYCVWTPGASPASSPARSPRKSGSTGSLSRWRRVSQLVVGRSSSVGRDKFGFFSAPASPAREEQPKAKPAASPGRKKGTEVGTVAASHRMFYGAAKPSPGAPRRTFLPYRQDLFGIFSAPKGLSRSQFQYQPAI